jgi:trans-aconitate 2-methyltransferase
MTWDPDRYMEFADLRSRPGLELIARINHADPQIIVDLGCGPGHLTAVLARRWPQARVIGIDDSAEMLATAETGFPSTQWPTIKWETANIDAWSPPYPISILYSNAALHWVGDHRALIPRLFDLVAPGGVMAIQMPDNWDQPTHQLISRLVDDPRWQSRTAPVYPGHPVARSSEYRAWLQAEASELDQWRTTYYHVLEDADPVLNWVKGSVLRPILAVLEPSEVDEFVSQLAKAYRMQYPREPGGATLLPFSRLFIVARKR